MFTWQPSARRIGDRWSDGAVLEAVQLAYRECVNADYRLVARPDRTNRASAEVDGILAAPNSQPIAIEVTALETFDGQLLEEARVNKLLVPLQSQLADRLPNGLWCIIPVGAFREGMKWPPILRRLGEFLSDVRQRPTPGVTTHEVPGVPFPVYLKYEPQPAHHVPLQRPSATARSDLPRSAEKYPKRPVAQARSAQRICVGRLSDGHRS